MTTRRTLLALLFAGVILDGCSCEQLPPSALTDCTQGAVFAGSVKTDILFVIDDSGSMEDEQLRLRNALARFVTTLSGSPIADDFQIGVTTTAVQHFSGGMLYPSTRPGTDPYAGSPVPYPSGTPYPQGRLTAIDPTTVDPSLTDMSTWGDFLWDGTQFTGNRILPWSSATLVDDFKRNVLVWTLGPGREQPFAAMEGAITTHAATGQPNDGFLRPGARLAVIFLSDEDDCSGPQSTSVQSDANCNTERAKDPASSALTSIDHFAQLLKGPLGGETRDVVLGAVVGVTCTGGVCTNTLCSGAARTPNRFLELLSAFDPARTALASICDPDFDAALDQFANAVMSQTMPLSGGVADPALLVVSVEKASGTVACTVAEVGTAGAAAADAVYTPPSGGAGATLTFQNGCALAPGDRISVDVICAG